MTHQPLHKGEITNNTTCVSGSPQEEYYATHQCFLTRRSLYLLLWNVMDGEEGLRSLKSWLENIEGRAPKSPVIVIGTHVDLLPSNKRNSILEDLQEKFKQMYIRDSHRQYTYPRIYSQCQFINVNATKSIDYIRDLVYEFAIQYKVHGKYCLYILNGKTAMCKVAEVIVIMLQQRHASLKWWV